MYGRGIRGGIRKMVQQDNKCKKCGGVNCQCKNKTNQELKKEKAEQATYENNGGVVIDSTDDCESCQ